MTTTEKNLLAPLMTLDTVRLGLDVTSRKRLYEEAAFMFEASAGIPHTVAFDALFAREKLGSTCLGAACAIPHGRVKDIDHPCAGFLRTAQPLSLDAPDGRAVQLFLCILIPDGDSDHYLKVLRETAAFFSEKVNRTALLQAQTEIEVCECIHNWQVPEDLHFDQDFSDDEEN